MVLPSYPSTNRNRTYIVEVLKVYLPKTGTVLETASGTGEHINFFCSQFPDITWQPSDMSEDLFWAIRERLVAQNNVEPPVLIDLTKKNFHDLKSYVGLVNINMIHIAPWQACVGLFRLAEKYIKGDGFVYMYGPFRINGLHTSESNKNFDLSLKQKNPEWGVRDLEKVVTVAESFGFRCLCVHEMPTNNKSVVFKKI